MGKLNQVLTILMAAGIPVLSATEATDEHDAEIRIAEDLYVQIGLDYIGLCRESHDGIFSFFPEVKSMPALIEQITAEIAYER